jgi:hypothetical protein
MLKTTEGLIEVLKKKHPQIKPIFYEKSNNFFKYDIQF